MGGPRSRPDPARELDARARLRVRIAGLTAALVAAVLLAAFGAAPRQALFDAWQRVLPAPQVSRQVHVVVIDAESLREVGGWPWSRFYLARLLEQIAARGASAIGFDMLFAEPDRLDPRQFTGLYTELPPEVTGQIDQLPSMDAVFARAIGRNPIVLARAGVRPGSFDFEDRPTAALPPEAVFAGAPPRGMLEFAGVVANLPGLDVSAAGYGLVNGDPDPDGLVRRVPLVARAAGQLTPGFALELVRVAEGADRVELVGKDGGLRAVRVGSRRIPSTPDGQLLLRFGDWRTTRTTSAVNLLRRGLPDDLFKGQIVLIGLTSAGASDVAGTPRAEAVSGVFVQAQAVDAILRGVGLQRPAWAPEAEWGAGLLVALLAWLLVARLRIVAVGALALTAAAAAFAASALSFQAGFLIDPLPILALGAAATAAMVIVLFVEGRRLHARLQTALEEERRRADERQRLLINELNHRVKNTLATVQSMAGQSFRNGRSPAEAQEAFVSRLIALSTAQNLLTQERWESANLAEVVRMAIGPFDDPPGRRFLVSGPGVRLEAQHALAIAMALHELAVNAAKFGALSVPGGHVRISWLRTDEAEIRFLWEESGGPLVEPPARTGFGTRLIQKGLARELGGQVTLEHRPEGLRCRIEFPLSAASPAGGPLAGALRDQASAESLPRAGSPVH